VFISTLALNKSKVMELSFFNVDFKLNGYLLYSFDILSVKSINVTFEYDYAASGFIILSLCNFPEATLIGDIIFKNNTVFLQHSFMNEVSP